MASRRSRPRRLLLPILLAAVLAAEITGIALARSIVPIEPVASSATDVVAASTMSAGRLRDDTAISPSTGGAPRAADARRDPRAIRTAIADRKPAALAAPVKPRVATPKPASSSSTTHVRTASATSNSTVRYAGRNHVWIPSLRINRSVSSFACTRTRPPDNYVYRWGCAGRNNVYLLGHAYSVFKPLHDAYVGGRLRKGMKVVYADALGHVHTYAVTWWRVVAPTTSASWAWAAQSRPSMTLQTCVGARSQYRLMVRLVQVS
jgi:sortase (surface protein transpeptidase)